MQQVERWRALQERSVCVQSYTTLHHALMRQVALERMVEGIIFYFNCHNFTSSPSLSSRLPLVQIHVRHTPQRWLLHAHGCKVLQTRSCIPSVWRLAWLSLMVYSKGRRSNPPAHLRIFQHYTVVLTLRSYTTKHSTGCFRAEMNCFPLHVSATQHRLQDAQHGKAWQSD